MWRFFAVVSLAVGGCAPVNYDAVHRGEFKGRVQLYWEGGERGALLGDGRFLYVRDKDDPLVLMRHKDNNPSGGSAEIMPEAFYTDGGSIPRLVQGSRGSMPGGSGQPMWCMTGCLWRVSV